MKQSNQQFNTATPYDVGAYKGSDNTTRKRKKAWDVFLWLMILALTIAVFVRAFIVSKVTVSGESMTSAYYNTESSEHYNPKLTYHDGDTVTVHKLAKPNRGDVVVFYKQAVSSKFLALFARGDSVNEGGQYYKLIKRVVALGGDKLWVEHIEDNKYRLVIQTPDGEILHENYYQKNGETLAIDCFTLYDRGTSGLGCLKDTTQDNPLVIEEGKFFAIGDNRVNSDDSRGTLGQVPLSQLFGVVS